MSSGKRMLLKVLVAVVSYGVVFALILALSQFEGMYPVVVAILAICGYRAIKHLPSLYFFGGESGQGLALTLFFILLKIMLSIFAGIFIAPWMIAKKLVSLVPGGEAEEAGEAEEE